MQKKGALTDFWRKIDETLDFVFFIWVIFLQKREIFAYFCLYFQIFYVLTPGANATQWPWGKFGLFNALVLSTVHLASFRSGQNRTLLVYFSKNNKVLLLLFFPRDHLLTPNLILYSAVLVSSSQIYSCARDWPMPEGTWSALEASLTKFHFFKSFRKTKIFD